MAHIRGKLREVGSIRDALGLPPKDMKRREWLRRCSADARLPGCNGWYPWLPLAPPCRRQPIATPLITRRRSGRPRSTSGLVYPALSGEGRSRPVRVQCPPRAMGSGGAALTARARTSAASSGRRRGCRQTLDLVRRERSHRGRSAEADQLGLGGGWFRLVSGRGVAGCDDRLDDGVGAGDERGWPASTVSMWALAFSAMARCSAGVMTRSAVPISAHAGIISHAGGPETKATWATEAGRWVAKRTAASRRLTPLAKHSAKPCRGGSARLAGRGRRRRARARR